jgi:hypothetical protein
MLLVCGMSTFGTTGIVMPGKGNIMEQQFDMNNSRRGSSPPFQEHADIPSRILPYDSDASMDSKLTGTPAATVIDGTAPAIRNHD